MANIQFLLSSVQVIITFSSFIHISNRLRYNFFYLFNLSPYCARVLSLYGCQKMLVKNPEITLCFIQYLCRFLILIHACLWTMFRFSHDFIEFKLKIKCRINKNFSFLHFVSFVSFC
jgi:hypothetical protein